jgi:hypothetical protein
MSDSSASAGVLRTDTVRIASRFNGPPTTGHGGYSAAMAALPLSGAAAVDLRRPVPLERALQRTLLEGGRTELRDGDALIAEGREISLALEVPPAPDWEESMQSASAYAGFKFHPFDTCFGCGTKRAEGDGLRIFSGPRPRGEGLAAPWVPDRWLAQDDGSVPKEMIWAALDCPSGWCLQPLLQSRFPQGSRGFTAQLAVRIDGTVRAGERYTTLGWLIEVEGRKVRTGAALYDERGAAVAVCAALWVVVLPKV